MKVAELLFSLFLLSIGLFVFLVGLTYPYDSDFGPGPGFMPVWVSGLMVFMTIILIISTIIKDKRTDQFFISFGGLKDLLFYAGLLLLAILMIDVLGMMSSLGLFCFIIFKFMENYNWWKSLLIAFGTMIVLFFIFRVWLKVPTPSGLLFF